MNCLISNSRTVHLIDFGSVTCQELQHFEIPYRFRIDRTAIMHGFGCWFDISFLGAEQTVVLSTSPEHPGTHWYQVIITIIFLIIIFLNMNIYKYYHFYHSHNSHNNV